MDVKKMASMGQKAMREQQSEAEKIFWPMQAGRPRQGQPRLFEAIHTGRIIADRLYSAVTDAGLKVEDARCVLVCLDKNNKVVTEQFADKQPTDVPDLEMARLCILRRPIGIAFSLVDQEKHNILVHARPFERENYALLESLLDVWELNFKREWLEQEKKRLK